LDKYEYKLKLDQMKSLTAEHNYEKAAEIADTINWNKIKNVNALVKVGEIYENTGRLEDSREVLLMAYDRSPIGRMIIYRLAKVAIKMKNFDEAKDYYQEFVEIAPHDNLKYVLKYEICKAQGANIETLIGILEELKEQEYTEEWAFELACLYHKAGMADKCVEACDELVLWFGDGPYVERALELKMIYQPLNKQQEEKYRRFCQKREGVVEVRPEEELDSGEIVNETVQIPDVKLSPERFNTQNLQEELQKSMQQIMQATEKETVTDSMDNIKKLVEEIPYLQLPKEEYDPSEEEEDTLEHIETDHEIDDSLKINFKELLAEEHDGQIGMYMPEKTALEHQITGQMSIEEVLAEWEKTKYAAEVALEDAKQRRLESAKARALQEAEEIMGRLADIIPKLDAGVAPKDILQDQYIEGKPLENDRAAAMVANMNQILQEEIDRISTETADIDKQLAEAAGTAASAMEPEPAASMGEISGQGVNAAELAEEVSGMMQETEDVEISGQEQIPGSQPDEEIADLSAEETDEETVDLSTEEKAAEEVSDISEEKTSEADDFDIVTADTIDLGKVVTEQALAEAVEHITDTESATDDITQKELADNTAVEVTKEVLKKEDRVERVLPEITEPEDETGFEAVTSLGEELRGIFTYFVSIKGMEEQICQALTGAARHLITGKDASTGNMVIQGGSGSGKTVLATAMVKALQKETGKPKGKVGKIEASALNKKDVASLLKKISGGCLIIEKAGDISKETAVRLALLLKSDTSGLFVIMEDTHRGIEKALGRDEGFASRFSEKINIPIFTSDELVSFAKAYANELGYTIDEMGILALYNSISNIQKYDKATTLTEVKEIVDDAIHKSEKGGLRKAFSIITSRRYDDEDYVILREKDFGI
jgi:putative tetratricopeptide repeat-containing domain protein